MPNATLFSRLAAGVLALLPIGLRAQQLDPTFHPPHFVAPAPTPWIPWPTINKVVRQSDGRYIVIGEFVSVDGHYSTGLARLLPTGYVDTTFTYSVPFPPNSWQPVTSVAVQSTGKILISRMLSSNQNELARLLPSGQPDSTFRPVLPRVPGGVAAKYQIQTQPDDKILLSGSSTDSLGRNSLIRLLPDGQPDITFVPPSIPYVADLLLEPNGRLVYVGGFYRGGYLGGSYNSPGYSLGRLLSSGRVDSSFVFTPRPSTFPLRVALCPDGGYAVGGVFVIPGVSESTIARLLSTGAWNTTFPFSVYGGGLLSLSGVPDYTNAVAVQPNGQIMVGGYLLTPAGYGMSLGRAMLQGGDDTSFDPDFIMTRNQNTYVFYNIGRVNNLLFEPSGKLLVAGRFEQAGGVPHWGLARLMPAAPLTTNLPKNALPLEVWPVPAHGELHVQLPTAQAAQQVELLDATGRRVLNQTARTTAFTLSTAGLPTGLYVLRVRYTDGTAATRRVVLE